MVTNLEGEIQGEDEDDSELGVRVAGMIKIGRFKQCVCKSISLMYCILSHMHD